ncbi:MAG: hypothetical protein A2W25_12185 [candidate division Zixibacteria bacterium RBG_16_53_22]|nr:MAG: hypothetical protein A2W25_12185 [candidate division Zixibacteria bacterium RBG_16_53_22]
MPTISYIDPKTLKSAHKEVSTFATLEYKQWTKGLTAIVPDEIYDEVVNLSLELGITQSEFMRRGLALYLDIERSKTAER